MAMGIYDMPSLPKKPILLLLLLVLDLYLLLPPSISLSFKTDKGRYSPGDEGVLWVQVRNNGSAPQVAFSVTASSLSPFVALRASRIVETLGPGSQTTLSFSFSVGQDAPPGDHDIRLFLALPGRTKVYYVKVRTG